MTLYLKYRPQKISELGLESVREMLGHILASGSWPHAFLFSGPRGTGKTSAARILAKIINCQEGKGEPCNKCDMCVAITQGSAADVMEIDAASNRGIDEIRALREKVKLAPMRAKYKVYIVDEVHMLTTEAANALLKTLEEPPAGVVFVLCTTEPEKLPLTVVSRCTQVWFKLPTAVEVEKKLKLVAAAEGFKIENKVVGVIVKAAHGSFRDAIKILEQVVAAGGDVQAVVGAVGEGEPERFVELLGAGERVKALDFVEQLTSRGANLRVFIEECVEYLREKMLVEVREGGSYDVGKELGLIEVLEKAYERMKSATVPQLPLEIAVIERTGWVVDDGAEGKKKAEPDGGLSEVKKPPPERHMEEKKVRGSVPERFKLDDVAGKWQEIMRAVKPLNHSVEALLRSTRPVGFDGRSLELEVFYKFHLDKLGTDKCRQIVEGAVTEVLGGQEPVRLKLKLGEKQKGLAAVTSGAAVENIEGAVEEDIIKAAQEIFKTEVI